MKTKIKLTLSLLTFFAQASIAQQFNWANPVKLKDNFFQYDVGQSPSGSLLLMSKYTIRKDFRQNYFDPYSYFTFNKDNEITLVQYDKQGNMKSANPFAFKNTLSVFYESIVSDQVYFIYSSITNNKCILFADVYTYDGNYVKTESIEELTKYYTGDDYVSYNFTVEVSDNRKHVVLHTANTLTSFDENMKKVWESPFEYKYLTDINIQDDGKVVAIGATDKEAILVAFEPTGGKPSTSPIYLEAGKLAENLSLEASADMIYVSYLYGDMDPKQKIWLGPARHIECYADGVISEKFDAKTLVSAGHVKTPFAPEILMAVSGKKKLDKVKGLEWLTNRSMFITEKGELIIVLEKEYTDARSTNDQYGRTIKTEYYTVNEDLICIKVDGSGKAQQGVVKRETKGRSTYDYLFSCATFYEKGKLHLMYNEGSSPYKLIDVVVGANMHEISRTETKTYAEHDVYLSIRNARKLKDGQYKVIGRQGKNVSSAVITF